MTLRVTPAPKHGDRACLLESSALDTSVLIEGISALELRQRLHAGPDSAWDWRQLSERGVIRVSLQNPPIVPEQRVGVEYRKTLEDGTVHLNSGQPARMTVDGNSIDQGAILPTSLYLAIAQQWARAGLAPVHSAIFEYQGHGVLALGNRASGKSVLTAAVMAAGGRVLTDDWALISAGDDAPRAARIRDFLMLRQSWATRQLTEHLKNAFAPMRDRPKLSLQIPEQSENFPPCLELSQLWLLRRPRAARSAESSSRPLARASAYAALIESSMPLLLSNRFPAERSSLARALSTFLRQTKAVEVTSGTDLVNNPKSTLESLLSGTNTGAGQA